MERTLGFRTKATPEVGRRSLKNLTNVFSFVRIVTEKFIAGCSFHEKSWLKNRVNSGKPALHSLWRMVILSQALDSRCPGKVQRLELRLVLFG
jgi:hypothetical protein